MNIRWYLHLLQALATDNVSKVMFVQSRGEKAVLQNGTYAVYRVADYALIGSPLAELVAELANDGYHSIVVPLWDGRVVLDYFLLVQQDKEHQEHHRILLQIELGGLSRSSAQELNDALCAMFGIQRSQKVIFRGL